MSTLYRKSGYNKKIDIPSYVIFMAICVIGWISLFAAVYDGGGVSEIFNVNSEIGRQTIWLGISLVAFIAIMTIDWKFWSSFAFLVYGFSIILLLGVLIFGIEIKGSKSWFIVAGFSFQPSEFAKLGTCLAMASLLGSSQHNIKNNKHLLLSIGVMAFPMLLILLQPDAGSALIFTSFLILLYRAGANPIYYILAIAFLSNIIFTLVFGIVPVLLIILILTIGVLFLSINIELRFIANFLLLCLASFVFYEFGYINLVFTILTLALIGLVIYQIRENKIRIVSLSLLSAIVSVIITLGTNWSFVNLLRPHQQDRINVWLRPYLCDPRGSLYNVIQSKTAIGSGGLTGSGFLKGAMTKLDFVPEQTTDFIFCTVGEEQGFLGVLGVIVLFTLLLSRILMMAERTRIEFIRYYMYGVAGIVFYHVFINIGMTMGLMPIIGIPLPLMSKGGSSLLVFFIMFAILFKMDLSRNRK